VATKRVRFTPSMEPETLDLVQRLMDKWMITTFSQFVAIAARVAFDAPDAEALLKEIRAISAKIDERIDDLIEALREEDA